MAMIRLGDSGKKQAATVRVQRGDGGRIVAVWLESESRAKDFPIWIKLSHDEALRVCAALATGVMKTSPDE